MYAAMPMRREIAAANLELCFPELDRRARHRLLHRHFRSLGLGVVEVGAAWWGSDDALARHSRLVGLDHLHAALARGRGAILLGAHFTNLEIGLRALSSRTPCHVVYRPLGDAGLDRAVRERRDRHRVTMVPRDDVRGMVRALRAGHPLWFAPDQNYAGKHRVFAPFFEIAAATIATTSRLAKISRAPVVPFFQHRLPGLEGYEMTLLPALEDFPGADPEADAARINSLIEVQVRRSPDQYLWTHRRFKTRPPGAAPVYRS